jgi:hypothetical protein
VFLNRIYYSVFVIPKYGSIQALPWHDSSQRTRQ